MKLFLNFLNAVSGFTISVFALLPYALYCLTIPLQYCLYYAYALVAFLLSPFWYVFHTFLGAASLVVGLVARLKYLYLYFAFAAIIGICAGCMLHGTSSFIFVLLGVDSATQHRRQQRQRAAERRQQQKLHQQQRLPSLDEADEEDDEEDDDYDDDDDGYEYEYDEAQLDEFGDSNFSGDSSSRQFDSSSLSSSRRAGKKPTPRGPSGPLRNSSSRGKPVGRGVGNTSSSAADPRLDAASDMFEDKWKILRSSEKPKRRCRGLLAQTILEESSESDFM